MQSQLARVVLLAAFGCVSTYAAERTRVDVYISNNDDSSILLGHGKPLASEIFVKVGIRVDWHAGEPGPVGRDGSRPTFGIRTVEYAPKSAGQQMNVAICNLGNVRGSVIAGGKGETELRSEEHT